MRYTLLVALLLAACGDVGLSEGSYDNAGAAGAPAPGAIGAAVGATELAGPVAVDAEALTSTTYIYINSASPSGNTNTPIYNDGSSPKHKCLRTVMMSVNAGTAPGQPPEFDCVSDQCFQHNSTFLKGRAYSCLTQGSVHYCKYDNAGSAPWRTMVYFDATNGCNICDQSVYNGSSFCGPGNNVRQDAFWQGPGAANTFTRTYN